MNKLEVGLVFVFLTAACKSTSSGQPDPERFPLFCIVIITHRNVLTHQCRIDTVGLGIVCFFNGRNAKERAADPSSEDAQYEGRLSVLCYTAWCLTFGLTLFAATANPSYGHYAWIGTAIGVFFIGIANYTIYASTIDYMVAAYGFYAASATGGNGFARDFLAGVLTPAGRVWIEKTGPQVMCGILAAVSFVFCILCVLVRVYGPLLRRRSKYTVKEANPTGEVQDPSGHSN